jgi:hypothetical protein
VLDQSNVEGKLIILSDDDFGKCTIGDFESIENGDFTFMSLTEYNEQ